jgi:hypothetical protein
MKSYYTAEEVAALGPDVERATLFIVPPGMVAIPWGVSLRRLVATAVGAWKKDQCSAELQLSDHRWLSGEQIGQLASRFGIQKGRD